MVKNHKLKNSKIPIIVFIQDEYLYQEQKAQFLKKCNVKLAFINVKENKQECNKSSKCLKKCFTKFSK